jgi:HEAT repeat protein
MTLRALSAALCTGWLLTSAPAAARGQEFLGKSVARWQDDLAPTKSAAERRSAAFALGKLGKAAVPALGALAARLDDPDAEVRDAATFAIGEICGQARVFNGGLLKSLTARLATDQSALVRRSAAFALGSIGKQDDAVRSALAARLKDAEPAVRQNAAWALGRMGDKALAPLKQALKDGDASVRRNAVGALNLLGEDAASGAIPELLACCGSADLEERKAAHGALVRLVGPEDLKDAKEPLLKGLKDVDSEIRFNAALAFANIGGPDAAAAVPVLLDALKPGDLNSRRQALLALGQIGPNAKAALPAVIAALSDPDETVRHNAAVACIGLKEEAEPAVPGLVKLLTNKNEAERVRAQAAVAISRIGYKPAVKAAMPEILKLAGDTSEKASVRERALWPVRLSLNNDDNREPTYKALLGILGEAKSKETKMLRYDAAYLLGMFQTATTPEAVLDVLYEFLKDPEIKIYSKHLPKFTPKNEPGAGAGDSADVGKEDGRIMAVGALKRIGVARVARRPEIVAQLRALHADPKTHPRFAAALKDYLPELERHLKQKGTK